MRDNKDKVRLRLLKNHFQDGFERKRGSVVLVDRFTADFLLERGVAKPVENKR